MSDPELPEATARKRTATEAMRLRPATRPRPGADPEVARHRAAGSIDALEQQLAELVAALEQLHAPLALTAGELCRECLLPHPCRTLRLVHPGAEGATPREEESQ